MAKSSKKRVKTGGSKKYYKKSKRSHRGTVARWKRQCALGLGLPRKLVVTHKYFETVDIGSTAGSTGVINYRCNSLYDPNATYSGHQPMYYDEVSQLYNHWVVIGSKITVTLAQKDFAGGTSATCAIFINDDAAVVPTLTSLVEQTSAKYTVLAGGANYTKKLYAKWSAKKNFGGSIMANNALQGGVASNPTEEQYYTIACYPQNLTSTQSYNLQVYIEYIAVWTEIKDKQGS